MRKPVRSGEMAPALLDVRTDVGVSSDAIRALLERVQAEYAEMPGLSVTMRQAQRLWAVDQRTCREIFSRLIASGVLRMTRSGRFVRV
jgi:hypothetical protein